MKTNRELAHLLYKDNGMTEQNGLSIRMSKELRETMERVSIDDLMRRTIAEQTAAWQEEIDDAMAAERLSTPHYRSLEYITYSVSLSDS